MRFKAGKGAFFANVDLTPERAHRPLPNQEHESVGGSIW